MRRLTSIGIVMVLISFSSIYVYGKTTSDPPAPLAATEASGQPESAAKTAKANEKLKADVLKLMTDAKAGKLKSPPQQFPPPTRKNNLSTGAKIGIAAGIGAAIFLIWMYVSLHDDDS